MRTCSCAVKNDFVQLVIGIFAIVACSAAEEMLPKVAGVGIPLLMAASAYMAMRRRVLPAVLFTAAAGVAEDALCGLPPATSASFFLAVAALARWSEFPSGALVMAYPIYQAWLKLWTPGAHGSLYLRALAAVPAGLVAAVAVWSALAWTDRRAAVDEA